MTDTARVLADFARAEPAARPFIERALDAAKNPDSVAFRAAYSSVVRRLGDARTSLPAEPPRGFAAARPQWTLGDWLRAAVLAQALAATPFAEHPPFVLALFEGGEIGEQECLLRTLGLLPEPERFVETALLACRTNARRVFEAIACENGYPSAHFPELGFNQMVLKAVFIEVPVRRIEGLDARRGSELERMARDYASERRAAGRPVPDDIELILRGNTA